jgi:hypothetical protein
MRTFLVQEKLITCMKVMIMLEMEEVYPLSCLLHLVQLKKFASNQITITTTPCIIIFPTQYTSSKYLSHKASMLQDLVPNFHTHKITYCIQQSCLDCYYLVTWSIITHVPIETWNSIWVGAMVHDFFYHPVDMNSIVPVIITYGCLRNLLTLLHVITQI